MTPLEAATRKALTRIQPIIASIPPDALMEVAIALTATAAFRQKEADRGHAEAADLLSAAQSTLSSLHLDFRRAAAKEGR